MDSNAAYFVLIHPLFAYAECKLSRPGPPATIVTIDEESPNGMYPTLTLDVSQLLARLLHIVQQFGKSCFSQMEGNTLLGLFLHCNECCFGNIIHINTP